MYQLMVKAQLSQVFDISRSLKSSFSCQTKRLVLIKFHNENCTLDIQQVKRCHYYPTRLTRNGFVFNCHNYVNFTESNYGGNIVSKTIIVLTEERLESAFKEFN